MDCQQPKTTTVLTARIVEWDSEKGYGFLQLGKEQVFLHRRDFAGHRNSLVVGDKIKFTLGQDAHGRSCAKKAVRAKSIIGIWVGRVLLLISLLALPVIALQRRGVDFKWVVAYGIALNALIFWEYARDKRRAQEGEWRVQEIWLHMLESLGGWPGAFLAQRWLRHKCSKVGYQFLFWIIVLAYQFVSFDSLQNWLSRAALRRLDVAAEHRR